MSQPKKRSADDFEEVQPPAAKKAKRKQVIDLGDLPTFISDPEAEKQAERKEIEEHGGRIRTLPVMAGHWPTHIYFSCSIKESPLIVNHTLPDSKKSLKNAVDKCTDLGHTWTLFDPSDLHISLAKTFSLRHAEIKSFCKHLGDAIRATKIGLISLTFSRWKLLVNDQKTTTFASIVATSDTEQVIAAVATVDEIMKRFGHPPFYENPIIHASLAWSPSDLTSNLDATEGDLDPKIGTTTYIKELHCKVGKVVYSWPLE